MSDVAKIVTVPVSGDERYLIKQMRWLHAASRANRTDMDCPIFPDVLCPRIRSSFADVRGDKFRMWQEMQRAVQGKFGFDLVYAPKTWEEFFLAIDEKRLNLQGEDLFYYHSGGLEGNSSMLGKYPFSVFFSMHLRGGRNANVVLRAVLFATKTDSKRRVL